MDIFERAANVLEHLAAHGIGKRPIVFIVHSLGGLLTKILLRKSLSSDDEDFKNVSAATKLIVFLSTPHTGSSLANALDVLPKTSKSIALLEPVNTNFVKIIG
ncbi:MAG: putative lipase [Candidatus Thiodiazotropha endolucinida]|nr:putative lipase [Candidatus Thiodiazotropha taylori]MCW4260192.1 putative lipase [Candidatus Thiodiazotropha endolucinida]